MQVKQNEIPIVREDLLHKQQYKCKLCERSIDSGGGHLDHNHETGYIRGVLCINCNLLEGMLLHKFNRSGLKHVLDYHEFLLRLVNYTNTQVHPDNCTNTPYVHPGHKTKQVKDFKKLNKPEMRVVLISHGIVPEGTKLDLVKQYRKTL